MAVCAVSVVVRISLSIEGREICKCFTRESFCFDLIRIVL